MEKVFIINGTRERIWELLLKAILRCLPLERINPVSDNTVNALLKIQFGFIKVPLDVNVVTADIVPNESVVTIVHAKGIIGLIKLSQKFRFSLLCKGDVQTEVKCEVSYINKSILLKIFWILFLPMIKRISINTFIKLEDRLKKWV